MAPKPGRTNPNRKRDTASELQFLGGAEGIRTPDPLHAMEVRYQLRYSPVNRIIWSLRTAIAYRLRLLVRTKRRILPTSWSSSARVDDEVAA